MADNLKLMREIFLQAHEVQNDERKKASRAGVGTYRGAMAGAVTDDGILSAKCPRLEQARLLGMEQQSSASERVMFSAGFGHELYIETQFKSAGLPYVREQSVEKLVNGRKWMGTPDFRVLIDGQWAGVEAKSLVSNFSVFKQMSSNWPYMRHILQSVHYMVAFEEDVWLICIGHYFYALANGEQYEPSIRWFEVRFDDKRENVIVENENGETFTLAISKQNVLDYLNLLSDSNDGEKLAPRPVEKELKMRSYNRCAYCPMESSCNSYDKGKLEFQEWMQKLEKAKKKRK